MTNRESERVLELSAEGGGVDFIRHWNEHRAWRFMYENLSPGVNSSERDQGRAPHDPDHPHDFLTLGDAIHALSPDGEWVSWTALDVHPDYRQQVWQLREQIIESTDKGRQESARQHDSQWSKACGQRLPKSRPAKAEQHNDETAIPPGSTLDLILGASIAVIEHLRKVPMSADEISEFETKLVHVLEKRKAEGLGRS